MIDFISRNVRDAAILTSSYVAGNVLIDCEVYNALSLEVSFTKGSLTDASIKIEVSDDGVNYYQLSDTVFSAGVNTVYASTYNFTGDYKGLIAPIEINTKYIKISAIGNGTATGSSMSIKAILGKIK